VSLGLRSMRSPSDASEPTGQEKNPSTERHNDLGYRAV
jgi:hypothetical protein